MQPRSFAASYTLKRKGFRGSLESQLLLWWWWGEEEELQQRSIVSMCCFTIITEEHCANVLYYYYVRGALCQCVVLHYFNRGALLPMCCITLFQQRSIVAPWRNLNSQSVWYVKCQTDRSFSRSFVCCIIYFRRRWRGRGGGKPNDDITQHIWVKKEAIRPAGE